MADYDFLFVGGSSSASATDQEVIDMIEAFGSDNWTGTFRAQSGSKSAAGFDLVVFASAGVFISNWNSWSNVDVPMFVPANRVSAGLEPFSSSGSRGGSHDDGRTPAGALHPILEDAGLAASTTYKVYGGAVQAFQNVADLGSGVDVLLTDPTDATEWLLAVAETGASMDSGTATNRRASMNELEDIDSETVGLALVESVMRWLVDGLAPAIDTDVSESVAVSDGAASFVPGHTAAGSSSVGVAESAEATNHQITVSGSGGLSAAAASTVKAVGTDAAESVEPTGVLEVVFDWQRPPVIQTVVFGSSPTDEYRDVLESAGEFSALIEVVDAGGEVFLTTGQAVSDEIVRWAASSNGLEFSNVPGYSRTIRVQVPVPDDLVDDLVPSSDGGGILNPRTGNKLRVSAGYQLADGSLELYELATMEITEVEGLASNETVILDVEAVDQLSLLVTAFDEDWESPAGANAIDALMSIVEQVFDPDDSTVTVVTESTEWTLPAMSAEQGSSRIEQIDLILESIGFHMHTDRIGRIQIVPVPITTIDDQEVPLWSFGEEAGSIPFSQLRRNWAGAKAAPAGVSVQGGAINDDGEEITVVVWDGDEQSETYYDPADSSSFAQTIEISNPLITSSQQAIEAGYAAMRRDGAGGGTYSFFCNPNPALRPNDVVRIVEPALGIDELCRIRSISMPTDLSGPMAIVARGAWDPEQGTPVIGTDIDTGGTPSTASVSDDFNRADENLAASSWTEFGYSWNLVSNRAEQNNSDLSFARFDTALSSTNHWAQATVARQPNGAGLVVGPMIRSNGQHQGYALIVFADNVLNLVKILNGSIVQTFGGWDAGASTVGDVLRIEADGSSIVGKVNGTTRITGTDSGFSAGRYAGMVGKGKFGEAAPPTLDDWSAGNL